MTDRLGAAEFAHAAYGAPALRRIWLCADDYGMSIGVNTAIRDLVARGRINAVSVMVAAPSLHRTEANALGALNAGSARPAAIGLHVTLTAPFSPLSDKYRPAKAGVFPRLGATLTKAVMHHLNRDALEREITAQLRLFIHTFGRAPDFIDGHQHVQLFPQVCDAVLKVAKAGAPKAWLRQCGRPEPVPVKLAEYKALLLDFLSKRFRQRATAAGIRTNPAFAGAYEYAEKADFPTLFEGFLDRLPDGSVLMCHPGLVDAELRRLDPLTTLREREYAFLAGESFPALLASRGVALA